MEWKTNQMEEKEQPLIEIHEEFESTAGGKCEGGVTFALFFSIFIAVSGSFTCGFAGGYSSPVHFAIIKDLHLSTAEYSLFGSLLTAGGLLGATVCGKLSDLTGRRGAMGLSSILCLAGWLSIAYSQDSMSLYIGRLALGFANGIMTYTIPVYVAEIAPKNIRGGLGLLHQFLMCCGIAAAFLVGLITSWRSLALMGTIPCMIQILGIFFIPESPRWLVTASSVDDFEAALKRLRGQHTDISEEAADIKEYTEAVENISEKFLDVFQMKYAYPLTVTLGLMALGGFGGTQRILYYASAIFESAGVPGNIGTIAMGLIQLPPFALCVIFMDKYGRRPLLLFSAAGMGVACFLVALSFLLKVHGLMMDTGPYLALVGILIFSASFPIGMGGIPCVIMSEVFPINIKGAAGTLATVVSSTSSWIVTYTFIFMMQWSSSGTFLVFTSVNAISVIFIAKLVPGTKGRTLEEIQELIIYKGPVMDVACNTKPLL
ncbi:sugar transporter ERD6-like 5 [Chenopodium quinoa]|uniref:sugar transporter ERD6-like 5 n=1 Tax=Chenopodium quinoa TaxID=63459 RepID=UPI000B7789C0|nr:sugar transporter ERD6-like 5 [Chenopodium quinoa]